MCVKKAYLNPVSRSQAHLPVVRDGGVRGRIYCGGKPLVNLPRTIGPADATIHLPEVQNRINQIISRTELEIVQDLRTPCPALDLNVRTGRLIQFLRQRFKDASVVENKVFGRFQPEISLGDFVMSEIFLGINAQDGFYVIKALPKNNQFDADLIKRFVREADIARKNIHPGVLPAIEAQLNLRGFWIAFPYIQGLEVDTYAKAQGTLTALKALTIFCRIVETLIAAEKQGILHRDIKPANFILNYKGKPLVYVLDFGFAGDSKVDLRITQRNQLFGTPGFLAKEIILYGSEHANVASESFSLGELLRQMFMPNVPRFEGNFAARVRGQAIWAYRGNKTYKSEELVGVPDELQPFVLKLAAFEADGRYQNFTDILREARRHIYNYSFSVMATGQS